MAGAHGGRHRRSQRLPWAVFPLHVFGVEQWIDDALGGVRFGAGPGRRRLVPEDGRESADRRTMAAPGDQAQRGGRWSVGHLSRSGLFDLASGQHLRPGLLEANRASGERAEVAAVLWPSGGEHGVRRAGPQWIPVSVCVGDHGPVGVLPGDHRGREARSPPGGMDLPRGDAAGDSVSVRPVCPVARGQRFIQARSCWLTAATAA